MRGSADDRGRGGHPQGQRHPGYRAEAGVIHTGSVTIGAGAWIGETSVVDIGATIGDRAQLGHASCLPVGGRIPDGERWHGTPAEPATADYDTLPPAPCGHARRVLYGTTQALSLLLVAAPLATGLSVLALNDLPFLSRLLSTGETTVARPLFYAEALLASVAIFLGALALGLVAMVTLPRLLALGLRPNRVYRLYGFHYWLHRVVARMTNVQFFTFLFGDSSYIVHYLKSLGYDLSHVHQTGSNFGMSVKHDTPFLSHVGSGTMVSDGLSLINAEYSSTSFALSHTSVGAQNFLGNGIAYPSRAGPGTTACSRPRS
ncbi:hypothetical protein NKH77_01905 [Streptomyces sp. M19]